MPGIFKSLFDCETTSALGPELDLTGQVSLLTLRREVAL